MLLAAAGAVSGQRKRRVNTAGGARWSVRRALPQRTQPLSHSLSRRPGAAPAQTPPRRLRHVCAHAVHLDKELGWWRSSHRRLGMPVLVTLRAAPASRQHRAHAQGRHSRASLWSNPEHLHNDLRLQTAAQT